MKKIFLLGGGGAIGSAIKEKFISRGYDVLAPRSTELNLLEASTVSAYMSKIGDVDFDALVFCAGRNNPAPIGQQTLEEIQKTLQVNCISLAQIVAALRAGFERRGKGYILGISSLYGSISREGRVAYSMSKHALNGFMRTLALELSPKGVLCNTLSPGFVKTKMTLKNNAPQTIRALERKIPLGFMASPADIAEVAYFLCSEHNRYICGQDIVVDGGFMAGGFQQL